MKRIALKEIIKQIVKSIFFEMVYTDVGHNSDSILWAWKDGNFKKTPTSKYKGHGEWWSATRDPVIFNAEYVGRFDNKTKILSIGLAGKAGLFTKVKINQVPKDLLQILKFEFGDHVKIKTFENS